MRRLRVGIFAFIAFCFPLLAHAGKVSLETFNDHVEIHRDAKGAVQSLWIKDDRSQFSFSSYTQSMLALLKAYQANRPEMSEIETQIDNIETGQDPVQTLKTKFLARETLTHLDFDQIANDPLFKELIREYDKKLAQSYLEQDVIAQLHDPTFFYRSTWRRDLLEWGIDLAQAVGGTTPGINVALYIFQHALDDLIIRRTFYQNFTLYYLENAQPASLGLTQAEAQLALSSLYEADISWYQFSTSENAKSNWNSFGSISNKADIDVCTNRLTNYAKDYSSIGSPLDFIFVPVTKGKKHYVINLRDERAPGDKGPSLAVDEQNLKLVRDVRLAYEIFLMGVNLAPLPGPVQMLVNWYVHAQYVPQIGSEGAMLAYYENIGDFDGAGMMLNQTVNPFIIW